MYYNYTQYIINCIYKFINVCYIREKYTLIRNEFFIELFMNIIQIRLPYEGLHNFILHYIYIYIYISIKCIISLFLI